MTLVLRSAARSDTGLVREHNEDAAYAGPYLAAVADGMGGQAAGEVASAVTIAAVARLDTPEPTDGLRPERQVRATPALAEPGPTTELVAAVGTAYRTLGALVDADVRLEGMGTTLTALLRRGDRVGLVHVGDSRGYLLRSGTLRRITRDHTFVQSLVDSGRLTEEQARVHPQRALLLRAIDGRHAPEPDVAVEPLREGDRYLLCSDGLCGVVPDATIAAALATPDRDAAAQRLVELARAGGGPDNITVVVVDVLDDARVPGPEQAPTYVGAAAELPAAHAAAEPEADTTLLPVDAAAGVAAAVTAQPGPDVPSQGAAVAEQEREEESTGAMATVGAPLSRPAEQPGTALEEPTAAPASPPSAPPPPVAGAAPGGFDPAAAARARATAGAASAATRASALAKATASIAQGGPEPPDLRPVRRWRRRGAILIALAVLAAAALALLAGWAWTRSQYYVGADRGEVVIYQGLNARVAGIELATVAERSGVLVSDLSPYEQSLVNDTIGASSRQDARDIVSHLLGAAAPSGAGGTASSSGTATQSGGGPPSGPPLGTPTTAGPAAPASPSAGSTP